MSKDFFNLDDEEKYLDRDTLERLIEVMDIKFNSETPRDKFFKKGIILLREDIEKVFGFELDDVLSDLDILGEFLVNDYSEHIENFLEDAGASVATVDNVHHHPNAYFNFDVDDKGIYIDVELIYS